MYQCIKFLTNIITEYNLVTLLHTVYSPVLKLSQNYNAHVYTCVYLQDLNEFTWMSMQKIVIF